ncbi:MAG: hypothetical protein ACREDH_07950 [Methylocella sp.]
MKLLPIIVAGGFICCSAANAVTSLGGTVTINIAGKFNNPVTPTASVKCEAIVQLVPNNLNAAISSLTLGSVLSALGEENASAQGVIATGGATFTCAATVPYRWQNIDPTMVQMAIIYVVWATDPGGTNPGKKKQLVEVIPIPVTGIVTTLNVKSVV